MKAIYHSVKLNSIIILLRVGGDTLPLFSRMNLFNLSALGGGGEQKCSFSAHATVTQGPATQGTSTKGTGTNWTGTHGV